MKKFLYLFILSLLVLFSNNMFAKTSPPLVLPTPILISPPNGATGVSVTPILDWSDVTGATFYRVQIFTGVSPIWEANNIPASTITVPSGILSGNTSYYWRVKAFNANDSSAYSGYFTFTTGEAPPAPPILIAPPDSSINVSLTATMDWSDVSGITSYRLQISTDPSFTTVNINLPGLTSSQYVLSIGQLFTSQLYYWRVGAVNSGGTTWSDIWRFITVPAPPAPPILVSPANGATGVSVTPLLNWNDVAGAVTYQVQLSTDPQFLSNLLIDEPGLTTSQYQVGPGVLSGLSQYYWRVRGNNAGGNGNYSIVWMFTTAVGPPAAPVLVSPLDSSEAVARNPFLDWNNVPNATSYRVQVSTVPNFGTTVVNIVVTSSNYTVNPALAYNTLYYWRVNATNGSGTGPWSVVWSFTTIPNLPPAPTLINPPNGATSVSLVPLMDWTDVSQATQYKIQISTVNTFTSTIVNQVVDISQFQIISGVFQGGTTYYWHVASINLGGQGAYTSTWSFQTKQTLSSNLKVYLEGFYNGVTQVSDTVRVYLANSSSPHLLRDSVLSYLGPNGTDTISFENAITGNYYIIVTHRNHLETWSSTPQFFQTGVYVNYDFTTSSGKAYGDINQDDNIDVYDYYFYITQFGQDGYKSSDLNGNTFIDGYDLPYLYPNFGNSKMTPP
jgi:hypothetical protein